MRPQQRPTLVLLSTKVVNYIGISAWKFPFICSVIWWKQLRAPIDGTSQAADKKKKCFLVIHQRTPILPVSVSFDIWVSWRQDLLSTLWERNVPLRWWLVDPRQRLHLWSNHDHKNTKKNAFLFLLNLSEKWPSPLHAYITASFVYQSLIQIYSITSSLVVVELCRCGVLHNLTY